MFAVAGIRLQNKHSIKLIKKEYKREFIYDETILLTIVQQVKTHSLYSIR